MARVLPFQAVRYDPSLTGDAGKVISPPYDQISEKMQDELYARDPHNFVRLIFGKILDSDNEKENRYTRAARDLGEWTKAGVLKKDSEPAFYAYEQKFDLHGSEHTRRGFVALMGLEPLGTGVLPHEKTFPKAKADRLSLIRACKANFEHVFFLYDDPKNEAEAFLAGAMQGAPLVSCKDDAGTRHAIWKVPAKDSAGRVSAFFDGKPLLIADGHHRYETSLTYQKEMRDVYCSSTVDEAPFNFRLGTFVSLQDKGLVILPTHRVIGKLAPEQLASLPQKLGERFELEEVASLEALLSRMKEKQHAFGLGTKEKLYLLTLKSGFDPAREFAGVPAVLSSLDVFLLHRLILERLLTLPPDRLDEVVQYVRWPEDAYGRVRSGECSAVFFLKPVKAADVKDVAQAGEKMPHKSTDFYPKLWSGLLFYKMEF